MDQFPTNARSFRCVSLCQTLHVMSIVGKSLSSSTCTGNGRTPPRPPTPTTQDTKKHKHTINNPHVLPHTHAFPLSFVAHRALANQLLAPVARNSCDSTTSTKHVGATNQYAGRSFIFLSRVPTPRSAELRTESLANHTSHWM